MEPKQERITETNPISGVLSMLDGLVEGLSGNNSHRDDVFRDEFDGIIVDTVKPLDTGIWETGISRDGEPWVIVTQYPSREDAEKGHGVWVRALKDNRNRELSDIDLWNIKEEVNNGTNPAQG